MDVQRPMPGEVALLQDPVTALRRRITELLQEWPEHPILAQLLTVSIRLLGVFLNFHIFALLACRAPLLTIKCLHDTLSTIAFTFKVFGGLPAQYIQCWTGRCDESSKSQPQVFILVQAWRPWPPSGRP